MTLQTKILLFYLMLNEAERAKFKNLVGPNLFTKFFSSADAEELQSLIVGMQFSPDSQIMKTEAYDIAIMQLVRHIVEFASSNVELARSIENMVGKDIPRPEKRSKYELQGLLLEALMEAPRSKLIQLRDELVRKTPLGKGKSTSKSSLDKWFSIILGANK